MELVAAIARVCALKDLTADEMAAAVGSIMDGAASPAQIGALLVALRMKGETVDEVVGAATAMRARATKLRVPAGVLVDTCGTGGDGRGTINVSTVAALVVAAAGVRVAKHGNRAQSSKSGSADVLEALGVDVAAPVEVVERCLEEVGIGFLFAPAFHGATRHVAAARKEIGVRTLFNLLGPLTNPAGAKHQLIGVYDLGVLEPMAHALGRLGSEHALVVHGDGLDEFATDGVTDVAELRGGEVKRYQLRPRDFGLENEDPSGLAGGDAEHNAGAARAILGGARGAGRSAVVMSAAAALYAAGRSGLRDGARLAEETIDGGAATALLERLCACSRRRS
ncbi:MAG: Anthranilate phosphoribosyltransferase [Myxococcales bacterium]|nr:Anthranilate phosphoribosyltransferase [Myxococcales bacterium]